MVAYHRWLIMKPLNAGWVHLIILRVPRGESRSFSSMHKKIALIESINPQWLDLSAKQTRAAKEPGFYARHA
jgi:hypothetical protein